MSIWPIPANQRMYTGKHESRLITHINKSFHTTLKCWYYYQWNTDKRETLLLVRRPATVPWRCLSTSVRHGSQASNAATGHRWLYRGHELYCIRLFATKCLCSTIVHCNRGNYRLFFHFIVNHLTICMPSTTIESSGRIRSLFLRFRVYDW